MKPLAAPNVPGNTEFEGFDNAVRKVFSVPKEALAKEETKWKRARDSVGCEARSVPPSGSRPTSIL